MIELILIVFFGIMVVFLLSFMLYYLLEQRDTTTNTIKDFEILVEGLYTKVEKNILRKFKGISIEDQTNIDTFTAAIKKDVNSSLKFMKLNENPLSLPDWPHVANAINRKSGLLASIIGNESLLSSILPLMGTDNPLVNLLTTQNAKLQLGANLGMEIMKQIGKGKEGKEASISTKPRSTREKDLDDKTKFASPVTKFTGKM